MQGLELARLDLNADPDQGEFTAANLSDLILWLDAGSGIVLSETTGRVQSWRDRSPNGYLAVAVSEAKQPPYSLTGGPNSRPAVIWDGSNRAMTIAGITDASNEMFVVAVLRQTAFLGVGDRRIWGQLTNGNMECGGVAQLAVNDGTADRLLGTSVLGEQYVEFHLDPVGLTSKAYRNGVLNGSAAYDGTGGWNGTATGIGSNKTGTGSFARMDLTELIITGSIPSTADLQSLRASFAAKYLL